MLNEWEKSIEQPSKDNNLSVRARKPGYEHQRLVASAALKLDARFVTLATLQQRQQGGATEMWCKDFVGILGLRAHQVRPVATVA